MRQAAFAGVIGLALSCNILFGLGEAAAQSDAPVRERRPAPAERMQPFMVSVPFAVRAPDRSVLPDDAAKVAMREQIFRMAAQECELLKKAFSGDCRLHTLKIADQNRRGSGDLFELSAVVTYRLMLDR